MHLICPPTTLAFKMYLQWRRNSQTTSWEARKETSTSLSPKDTKYPGSQEIQKFVSIYFKKWEKGSPMQHFWAQKHCSKHFGPDYQNPLTPTERGGAICRTWAPPALVSWVFLGLSQASRGICTWSHYCTVPLYQHGKQEEAWPPVTGCTQRVWVPCSLEGHSGGRQGEQGSKLCFPVFVCYKHFIRNENPKTSLFQSNTMT